MTGIPRDALLLYHRQGDALRFKTESMTNHELREIMVGMWARLDAEDREDFIKEITEYNENPDSFLSSVSSAIARGVAGENAFNFRDVKIMAWKELHGP